MKSHSVCVCVLFFLLPATALSRMDEVVNVRLKTSDQTNEETNEKKKKFLWKIVIEC